jgi:putative transposase
MRRHIHGLKVDDLVTEHATFLSLGGTAIERQAAYRELFLHQLDQKAVAQIRAAINAGCALGSEEFLKAMEARLGRPVGPPKHGRPSKQKPDEQPSPVISGKLF